MTYFEKRRNPQHLQTHRRLLCHIFHTAIHLPFRSSNFCWVLASFFDRFSASVRFNGKELLIFIAHAMLSQSMRPRRAQTRSERMQVYGGAALSCNDISAVVYCSCDRVMQHDLCASSPYFHVHISISFIAAFESLLVKHYNGFYLKIVKINS